MRYLRASLYTVLALIAAAPVAVGWEKGADGQSAIAPPPIPPTEAAEGPALSLQEQIAYPTDRNVELWFDNSAPIEAKPNAAPGVALGELQIHPSNGASSPEQTGQELYVPLTDEQQLLPTIADPQLDPAGSGSQSSQPESYHFRTPAQ